MGEIFLLIVVFIVISRSPIIVILVRLVFCMIIASPEPVDAIVNKISQAIKCAISIGMKNRIESSC